MPRNVRLAVMFSFILHGILILAGRYRFSYDAYIHMFFGDHYHMDWWSLWDTRWYTGFFVNSYPPLAHQLIGLLSHIIGLDAAFALLLWITVTLLPLAVFSFSCIFGGKSSAGYASLGAAFLPSIYLTAHIFGQLPTLIATTIALFAAVALHQYLQDGWRLSGTLAISLTATMMAFHHATLLLLPWLILAITAPLVINKQVRRHTLILRLLFFGLLSTLAMLIVIWPFWDWGRTQSIQTPIDHLSRHNFFKDPFALLLFFLPMYGPLIVIIPSIFSIARKPQFIGLGFSFLILFLLGLGGTTLLPRLFFGKGWEWLTYDRFAFWASIALLPFFGMVIILMRRKNSRQTSKKFLITLAVFSLVVGSITTILPLQPGAVDMGQVVDFLKRGDHSRWRYLTFGFGDQLALLSTLTPATTIDGSYHTARALPELRTSGIGQIDTVFWSPTGLSALDPILQKASEHGVRWGFVNVPQYVPVLERNGWKKLTTLKGGIQVWENPNAIIPSPSQPPPINPLASFSWGMFPGLSLIISLSLGSLRIWPLHAMKVLREIRTFLVGLIPISLCFWYYRTLVEAPHDRVYFTYTNALFFLSDALALFAVILWLSSKVKDGFHLSSFILLPLSFSVLTSLSVLWSIDWRTSLYISLHIWLVFLLILSHRDWSQAWTSILVSFCAALSLQFITGFVEFINQSTAFLDPLNMNWPGLLTPSVRGASIVQLPNGESFLRAYGTLPHPNILGGFTFTFLLGPTAFFMRKEKPNNLAILLLIPGISLLALSFSRSAWLAFIAFSFILIWKSKYFERKRLATLLIISVLSFTLSLLPYSQLVQARIINTSSHSEEFSLIGRAWLSQEAKQMFLEHPLTGYGIGSFIIKLAQRAGEGYVIEPVHNIFLLAAVELGIPGLFLLIALGISFAYRLFKAQHPNVILTGATIVGLSIISLFDHYLWTLAAGRLMLGFMVGLFAGQGIQHDA